MALLGPAVVAGPGKKQQVPDLGQKQMGAGPDQKQQATDLHLAPSQKQHASDLALPLRASDPGQERKTVDLGQKKTAAAGPGQVCYGMPSG